jgi:hypothetical protein
MTKKKSLYSFIRETIHYNDVKRYLKYVFEEDPDIYHWTTNIRRLAQQSQDYLSVMGMDRKDLKGELETLCVFAKKQKEEEHKIQEGLIKKGLEKRKETEESAEKLIAELREENRLLREGLRKRQESEASAESFAATMLEENNKRKEDFKARQHWIKELAFRKNDPSMIEESRQMKDRIESIKVRGFSKTEKPVEQANAWKVILINYPVSQPEFLKVLKRKDLRTKNFLNTMMTVQLVCISFNKYLK